MVIPLFLGVLFQTLFENTKLNKVEALLSAGEVKGWIWSDNIGWISLNCANTNVDSCANVSYKVSQDDNGNWTGYGWNDNIGWLSFNAGCPVGVEGVCSPKITDGNLTGWARFTNASLTDNGWDGWVSFSSSNDHDSDIAGIQVSPYSYGGVLSGNHVGGYVWGSDVVGWLEINATIQTENIDTLFLKPTLTTTTVNSSNIESLPDTISVAQNGNINLYWYTNDSSASYTSCDATSSIANDWVGSNTMPIKLLPLYSSGLYDYSSFPGEQTYTITCNRDDGSIDMATATVTSSSPINGVCGSNHFICEKGNSIDHNGSNPYSWGCEGINGGLDSFCQESNPINGLCGSTHFNCISGVSTSHSSGSPWTWICEESNGGISASCKEDISSGNPQCSDGLDNDNDQLIDFGLNQENDPGCNSSGDNSERSFRPIFIEI